MLQAPSALSLAALHLFDELAALSSITRGSGATEAAWRDCAVRLELAAQDHRLSVQAQRKLAGRAAEARQNAASAASCSVTTRVPVQMRSQLPAVERCPGCGLAAHASETDDGGFHPACRPSSEKVTQRIPRVDANWRAGAVRLAPVHMPAALDAKFARAVTQALPVFGGDEVRS